MSLNNTESNPYPHAIFLKSYHPPSYTQVLPLVSFQSFWQTWCTHFSPPPCAPHVPLIVSSLTSSFQYQALFHHLHQQHQALQPRMGTGLVQDVRLCHAFLTLLCNIVLMARRWSKTTETCSCTKMTNSSCVRLAVICFLTTHKQSGTYLIKLLPQKVSFPFS